LKFSPLSLPITFVLSTLPSFAADPIVATDKNGKFTMEFGGGIEWQIQSTLASGQANTCGGTPEGHEPYATLCAVTYVGQKNAFALTGDDNFKETTKGFLEGICKGYQCVDISNATYEEFGDKKAWIAATKLNLPSFVQGDIADSIFISTATPEGYMQLFAVHTKDGSAQEYSKILKDAVASVVYDK